MVGLAVYLDQSSGFPSLVQSVIGALIEVCPFLPRRGGVSAVPFAKVGSESLV